jgi:hypothetical protein
MGFLIMQYLLLRQPDPIQTHDLIAHVGYELDGAFYSFHGLEWKICAIDVWRIHSLCLSSSSKWRCILIWLLL